MGVLLINQKKSGEHPEKIWVDFTGYPSNHFSGCRLNGQILSQKELSRKVAQMVEISGFAILKDIGGFLGAYYYYL